MKLVDFAWNTATSIGQRGHDSLRVVLDEKAERPLISGTQEDMLIRLPIPTSVRETFYTLQGLYFDTEDQSWGSMWRLFKASLYHASFHAAYSDFSSYSGWARGKETNCATFSISLFEDYYVTLRAAKHWPGTLSDIAHANYLSSLRVNDPNEIQEEPLRVATKTLLSVWGLNRFAHDPPEEDIRAEELAVRVCHAAREAAWHEGGERAKVVENCLDDVYREISERGTLEEVPALPHTESHGPTSLFGDRLVEGEKARYLVESAYAILKVPERPAEEELRATEEGREFSGEMLALETRKLRLRELYQPLISKTQLEAVEVPVGDYGMFLRTRAALSGPIRTIRDRLSMILNEDDEEQYHNSGQIDTQLAMQALATKQNRTDVFTRYEPTKKNEAWAVLLDSSKSLNVFDDAVRGIATCLAEVANKLIPSYEQWALFGFNSTFQVLKDFSEKYGVDSKARIGGITQRNLTYLPDALMTCYRRLAAAPVETRIMVVISDGYPVGYPEIEEKLVGAIRAISKTGVPLIGIGVESPEMRKYFRTSCILESPYQMMKFFVNAYREISP